MSDTGGGHRGEGRKEMRRRAAVRRQSHRLPKLKLQLVYRKVALGCASGVPSEDPDRIKHSVGRKVAELRNALGLTQQALAERIGDVTPQYVGLVEQGRQNLTIETLVKVSNALEVHVRVLFEPPRSLASSGPGRPPKSSTR